VKPLRSRVLEAANELLRPAGVRIQRTNATGRSFADFFRHLKSLGITFRTVIDVGIATGTPEIYRAFPDASYVLVEPLAEFEGVLQQLQQRLTAQYFIAAAGGVNGETTINVHEDLSGSSLLRQAEGVTFDGTPRTIPVRRLDGLLPPDIAQPCLLKIDTQGTELDVVEGLGRRIEVVDVMLIETSLLPFREGTAQLFDVVADLKARGFVVYDIIGGHCRVLDNALAQVDLVLIPESHPLRQDARFFSDTQLHEYMGAAQRKRRPL
jgi:FkbM family methyltransferase